MKRTLQIILIATTLLTLLFTSCNADASAGLFRQIADSKAPVGITYRQIIGTNTAKDTLYFLTNDGIYSKQDGTSATLVFRSTKPILSASLDATTDTLYYTTNRKAEDKGGIAIWQVNTDGSGNKQNADPALFGGFTKLEKYLQLPNGYFVVQGEKVSGTRSVSIVTYNGTAFTEVKTIDDLVGYDLLDTYLLGGHESEAISATTPLLITLVKGSSYIHYYTDGTNVYKLTLDKRLAGFGKNSTNLYLITEDGYLYGSSIPSGATTPKKMKKLSRQYSPKAFIYATSNGTNTYLITKTKADNEALYLVSFLDGANDENATVDEKVISAGYAKQMGNVNIVSAFEKSAGNLLIATEKNGMFDISITDAPTGEGTSKGPEDYTI